MYGCRVILCVALAALLAGVIACSGSPSGPAEGAQVGLQVQFKPSLMTTLIDTAELRVAYLPAGDTLYEGLQVRQGRINGTLTIPPGDSVEFYLNARDEDEHVLYKARETREVPPGSVVNVTLSMQPVVSMLRPSPMYQEVAMSEGGEIAVSVYLYNVSEVFSTAFRLMYDPAILEALRVDPGSYLGSDIFMAPRIQDDYVAVGLTRIPPATGGVEDDSGHLVTIYFSAVGSGDSDLVFDASRASFLTADGQSIPKENDIVFETGTIVVNAEL